MADETMYLPYGALSMNIAFWIVVGLLLSTHWLRHRSTIQGVEVDPNTKQVYRNFDVTYWLSLVFVTILVAAAMNLFKHHFGDWPLYGQVSLGILVFVYGVVDFIFWDMVSHIASQDLREKIKAGINKHAEARANEIVEARDEVKYRTELEERMNAQLEVRAARLVSERDSAEFERLREEKLAELVGSQFEKQLQAEIKAGALDAFEKRLLEDQKKMRSGNLDFAIWIGIQGTPKAIGDAFGFGDNWISTKVLAIPYWVEYDPSSHKPRLLRFDNCTAHLVEPDQVSCYTKRWDKIEGQNKIFLNGAVISAPA